MILLGTRDMMKSSAAEVTMGQESKEKAEYRPEVGEYPAGRRLDNSATNAEIAARRAVVGVDEDILRAGGSPDEADAVALALRKYLLGDETGAISVLLKTFPTEVAEEIFAKLASGAKAA